MKARDKFTGGIDASGQAISGRVETPDAVCEVQLATGGFGAIAADVHQSAPYCMLSVYPKDLIMPPVAYLTTPGAIRRLAQALNHAADEISKSIEIKKQMPPEPQKAIDEVKFTQEYSSDLPPAPKVG